MEKLCPMLHEPCIENRCAWYIQLLGKHPQKDAPVEEWACAMRYLPILLIETSQQIRQNAAAVESARNEARTDAAAVAASVVSMAEGVRDAARAMVQRDPVRVLEAERRPEKPRGLLRFFRGN